MNAKIAISLPKEQVAAARRAVAEGRAASVSAYISAALARYEHHDGLARLIADLKAEGGEPTAEDYVWADRVLGLVADASSA